MKKTSYLCQKWEAELIQKYASDISIHKTAGLMDDLGFDEVASTIVGAVKSNVVKEDSPSKNVDAVASLFLTGTLFRVHPILGIAYGAARALGVDTLGMLKSVFSALKEAISAGKTLSMDAFDSLTKNASKDFPLVKTAYGRGPKPNIPWYVSKKNSPRAGLLQKIFGNIGKLRGASLAAGIIIWALKTALVGAGLLTLTGAVIGMGKDYLSPDEVAEKSEAPEGSSFEKETVEKPKTKELAKKFQLTPSGAGEKRFQNDALNTWVVPLVNNNVEDTLLTWIVEIYPQLRGTEQLLANSSAFKRCLMKLQNELTTSAPNSLMMPEQFHSRKEVVDSFIQEII